MNRRGEIHINVNGEEERMSDDSTEVPGHLTVEQIQEDMGLAVSEMDHLVHAVLLDIQRECEDRARPEPDLAELQDVIEHLYNVYHDIHAAARYFILSRIERTIQLWMSWGSRQEQPSP